MKRLVLAVTAAALAACANESSTAPNASDVQTASLNRSNDNDRDNDRYDDSFGDDRNDGAAFLLSNQVSGNAVLVYNRRADGSLVLKGSVASGGTGTGAGLGSQGALAYSPEGDSSVCGERRQQHCHIVSRARQ